MWNILIAGLVGGVAYLVFKEDKKDDKPKANKTKKKVVRSSKSELHIEESIVLLNAIKKEGFDSAIRTYSDYSDIEDAKFHSLVKSYKNSAGKLEKYITSKNPSDAKFDVSTSEALNYEGLDYGFLSGDYNDWKGVKDAKFQDLLSDSKDDYKSLVNHITKKYKISNLNDSEIDSAIKRLEGK